MVCKMRELGILVTGERQTKQQEVNLGGHKAECQFQILFWANSQEVGSGGCGGDVLFLLSSSTLVYFRN